MFDLSVDVVLYHMRIKSYGRDKVSPGPQTTFGKLLGLFLNPPTCLALEDLHDVGDGVLGWNRDDQVDMLISDVPRA